MPEDQVVTTSKPESDSEATQGKAYDETYIKNLKDESIQRRQENKQLKAEIEALRKDAEVLTKLKTAFGGTVEDPNTKVQELINQTQALQSQLVAEKKERLILSKATQMGISDVDLLSTLLKDVDFDERNVEKVINDTVTKHPVLKQNTTIGVLPVDSQLRGNLKDEKEQAKYMNTLIRSAR